MFTVNYRHKKEYGYIPNHEGLFPTVLLNLRSEENEVDVLAIVDTGTQFTLIPPQYVEALDLDLVSGTPREFRPATGNSFIAYGHHVSVGIFSEVLDTVVYFPEVSLMRCLLGRDVLSMVPVGFHEAESTLYLFKF